MAQFNRLAVIIILLAALPPSGLLADAVTDHDTKPSTSPSDLYFSDDLNELSDLSLEQLMGIQVTSVAGVEQEWFQTPAAMHVITSEDIRRTGHRSLAETLRLVPGMTVGRIGSNLWAVGTRGFNGRFTNKLLVMVDGRTVYDPVFSGTHWDVQDILMEDVDRVEVIRGPGATLWGANAVNGVVNVTTKSARQTQGLYVSAGGGNLHEGFMDVRYGDQLSENTWYRVWGKYFNLDAFQSESGGKFHDDWDMARGGFRIDIEGADNETLTIDADLYHTPRKGQSSNSPVVAPVPTLETITDDGRSSGGHFLVKLSQEQLDHGWSLKGYYERAERDGVAGYEDIRNTFDLDFRLHTTEIEHHSLIWGLGYRHTEDRTISGTTLVFSPEDRNLDTVSGFIQDTISLIPDELFVMFGVKLEDNTFTDFEAQPSARIWWTPDDRNTLWGAISRPVRVPSRTSRDLQFILGTIDIGIAAGGPPSGVIVPISINGSSDIESEELTAYELGYRTKPSDNVTIDIAAFYHDYRNFIEIPDDSGFGEVSDKGTAESYGFDVSTTWQVAPNWRIQASYNFLRVLIHDDVSPRQEDGSPRNQARIISALDINDSFEFNGAIYYYDSVHSHDVDSYIRLDLGLSWQVTPELELTVWGQNLLDAEHKEFNDPFLQSDAVEIPRSFYAAGTFRF